MKNTRSFLLSAILLSFLFACNNEKGKQPDTSTVEVSVSDYETKKPIPGVSVEMQNGGITTPVTTTDDSGNCSLTNITAQNKYMFGKSGYEPYELFFLNFSNLTRIDVSLKEQSVDLDSINLRGYTYNSQGQPSPNVQVSLSNGSISQTVLSGPDGFYNLDAPRNNSYRVTFSQTTATAEINLMIISDTTETSLYVDGFTIIADTTSVN